MFSGELWICVPWHLSPLTAGLTSQLTVNKACLTSIWFFTHWWNSSTGAGKMFLEVTMPKCWAQRLLEVINQSETVGRGVYLNYCLHFEFRYPTQGIRALLHVAMHCGSCLHFTLLSQSKWKLICGSLELSRRGLLEFSFQFLTGKEDEHSAELLTW